jgi:hypothetical protein
MTRNQHVRYIPNLDPSRKKINVIARLEAFVNNPNINDLGNFCLTAGSMSAHRIKI